MFSRIEVPKNLRHYTVAEIVYRESAIVARILAFQQLKGQE